MSTAIIANLEKMLGGPRDGALLRYSLGNELLKAGDACAAATRFRETVERDPSSRPAGRCSAGRWLWPVMTPRHGKPIRKGIGLPRRGRHPGGKEMTVFARRLQNPAPGQRFLPDRLRGRNGPRRRRHRRHAPRYRVTA